MGRCKHGCIQDVQIPKYMYNINYCNKRLKTYKITTKITKCNANLSETQNFWMGSEEEERVWEGGGKGVGLLEG